MCSRCSSSGSIVATHKKKGGLFAFRCTCSLGERWKHFTEWSDRMLATYSVDFFKEAKQDVQKIKANDTDKEIDDCPF